HAVLPGQVLVHAHLSLRPMSLRESDDAARLRRVALEEEEAACLHDRGRLRQRHANQRQAVLAAVEREPRLVLELLGPQPPQRLSGWAFNQSIASSTSSSLDGRGMSTAGVTFSMWP